MAFMREVKMKIPNTKVTEKITLFVCWVVAGILFILFAIPIITSINESV